MSASEIMLRPAAIAVACLIGAAVAWKIAYPTYTHRYRLTISVQIDGRVHTGSSVIEIAYVGQPHTPDVPAFVPHVRGQAAFVDLVGGAALVAALSPGPNTYDASNVTSLAMKAYDGGGGKGYDAYRTISAQKGRRDLKSDNMPLLIWFKSTADPKSAQAVNPDMLASVLGESVNLAAAYVEITDDPIVIDLDKKLPWLGDMGERDRLRLAVQRQGQLDLTYKMFVGAGT